MGTVGGPVSSGMSSALLPAPSPASGGAPVGFSEANPEPSPQCLLRTGSAETAPPLSSACSIACDGGPVEPPAAIFRFSAFAFVLNTLRRVSCSSLRSTCDIQPFRLSSSKPSFPSELPLILAMPVIADMDACSLDIDLGSMLFDPCLVIPLVPGRDTGCPSFTLSIDPPEYPPICFI